MVSPSSSRPDAIWKWIPPAGVVSGVVRAMRAIQNAMSSPLRPETRVAQAISAVSAGKAVAVAGDLDLAEHLSDGPLDIDNLAGRCGVDPSALDRLLRVLVLSGWFHRPAEGVYANNRSSAHLASGHPNSVRGWARFIGTNTYWSKLGDLGDAVTHGVAQPPTMWKMFEESPEEAAIFDDAMAESARFVAPLVAGAYDWSRAKRLCDIGGGTGMTLTMLLDANRGLVGAVAEIAPVAEKAAARFESVGIADRASAIATDAFESVPGGYDHYLMTSILHDWDDEACLRLLENVSDVMPPGGRLVTVDSVIPETGLDQGFAHELDLQMLVLTGGGRERTVTEFEALFASAGLRLIDDIRLKSLQHMLVAEPKD